MPGYCFRCKEHVHAAEEKLALKGSSCHLECFTCAICNKTLDSRTHCESTKTQEIYCRACYKRHYCIPGYGFGHTKPALLSVPPINDEEEELCSCPTCSRPMPSLDSSSVFVPPPSRRGQEYAPPLPTPHRQYTKQAVVPMTRSPKVEPCKTATAMLKRQITPNRSRASPHNLSHGKVAEDEHQFLDQRQGHSYSWNQGVSNGSSVIECCPTPSQQRSVPKCHSEYDIRDTSVSYVHPGKCLHPDLSHSQRVMRNKNNGRRIPTRPQAQATSEAQQRSSLPQPRPPPQNARECQKCGHEVFFAERVMGSRGVYHSRCFACSDCEKLLNSSGVNEHQGQLYCKGCYNLHHGLSGVLVWDRAEQEALDQGSPIKFRNTNI